MTHRPSPPTVPRRVFDNWRPVLASALVLAAAALAGLTVVAFTELAELALAAFSRLRQWAWWSPLLWTPLCCAGVVWLTRRFAPGAAGSGIPQVMAALSPGVDAQTRSQLFVSWRLSISKMLLTAAGLLGGLSLGREGPSVQVAAGIMVEVRRWLPAGSRIPAQGLLIAGGAAGIAAAFNTPLGGILFAIEELGRRRGLNHSGLLLAAIVLAGLVAVSINGNATYFGVIRVIVPISSLLWPALLVAMACGLAGGLFARLLVQSLSAAGSGYFETLRRQRPIRFAAWCGLAVAVIGIASEGVTFGSGYAHTQALINGQTVASPLSGLLMAVSTWITTWSGVPGGIFAPSLTIGASLGQSVAQLTGSAGVPTLIALGMAGFLAAVTQAPLTAFIIVMEMVDGHALVLSLMASALVASGISRLISPPLYTELARLQLARIPPRSA